MKRDGSRVRHLTPPRVSEYPASWSPDGRELVVAREGSRGESDLYVVGCGDGGARRLVAGKATTHGRRGRREEIGSRSCGLPTRRRCRLTETAGIAVVDPCT